MSETEYVKTKPFVISLLILSSSFVLLIGGSLILQSIWALIPVGISAPVLITGIWYGVKYT